MNKRNLRAVMALTLVFVMLSSSFAFAGSKMYLALGNDLDAKGTATVMKFFDVDIDECEVLYITNQDEYNYLSNYVPASEIGNKALSSVLIRETSTNDIDVEIHNINYCTEDMYENALATAGVKGANVIVAGPYEISGTAALVGTIKAYEKMTGEEVGDEVIEAAVDEITTTGDIGEEVGDKEGVADIVADVKEKIANHPNMSDSEIIQAIRDAADKFDVHLTEENIEKLKNMISKLQGLDIDWDNIANKSIEFIDKVAKSGVFERFINWVKSLFD